MAIESIVQALADVYRETFDRTAGDLWIKRVTACVPESVNEWPWLYFVLDTGEVTGLTLPSSCDAAVGTGTVRRRGYKVVHRFKGQLLVQPRRNLQQADTAARPFVQAVIRVTEENYRLARTVLGVQVVSYSYGVLTFGQVDQRAVEYIGVEFVYEAREVI
jgi:hypothetical protein